ncbi:MAG: efflux RND transporter permease subunit [Gemmatimonadetes bacterium]|nr:efflux RND transporter permease subunit [Gemmatimonadota bacterium]
MKISDTSINRPVFTTMAMAALVLFGFLGYRAMGINRYPNVDFPTVSITTSLFGASPEVIETDVTDVLESQLNSIEGIRHIYSTSQQGLSQVTVEFELGRDVDVAAQDVREKVSTVLNDLPEDADPPVVSKLDITSQPFMWIALSGISRQQLGEYARWTLRPRLQTIEGVGDIRLGGYQEREIRVWLNRELLEGQNLTVGEVVAAIRGGNLELPGGLLESQARETLIKVQGEVLSVEEFENLVLTYNDGAPVRLRDVGRVEDGVEPQRGVARYNRSTAMGLGIATRSGANTPAVAERVLERLKELEPQFPPGMEWRVAFNAADFIERSIEDVQLELLYGAFFATLVVFLFLRSLRSTLIIALALPTSLIGTFAFISAMGFTLNDMTTLALALAVGVVIDDAIVVLENIYRHIEEGKDPREAASFGTDEIALAVAATTFSLAAVFIPVAFMEGIVGRFLFQFGMTVAIAITLSLIVSFTLTPMLCARFLRHTEPRNRILRAIGGFLDRTEARYRGGLDRALRRRWLTLGAAAAVTVAGLLVGYVIPKELTPTTDESGFVVFFETPVSSSLSYTDGKLREMEEILFGLPEIRGAFAAAGLFGGVNSGIMFVRMPPPGERERGQDEVMTVLRERLNAVPGVRAYVNTFGNAFSGGGSSSPFQFVLLGPELPELKRYSEEIMGRLRERVPSLVDLRTDLELQKPEVRIEVDRDKAAALGVDVQDVSQTVNALIGSQEVSTFKEGGRRYDVRVRVEDAQRQGPEDVARLTVRAGSGELVRLDNLVSLQSGTGVNVINRQDRQRAVTLEGNFAAGGAQGAALEEARRVAAEVLPQEYTTALTGASETFQQTFSSLIFALLLALIVTYMLLASQFESFVHPFTIMLAVPLAAIGALGLLWATGMSLNLFSAIGMLLLIGLAVKNSILLVDYTLTLRRRGLSRDDAIRQAGPVRLRPILMTSLAIVMGLAPIALALSEGSETRQPLAIAVIGGIFTSTLLTLFVIPVVYTLVDDAVVWMGTRVRSGARSVAVGGRRLEPTPGD